MAEDLKMGQYLKVRLDTLSLRYYDTIALHRYRLARCSSSRYGEQSSVYSLILRSRANRCSTRPGCVVNYVVMVSVVTSQRDILLSPSGTNVWSGQKVQGANTDAVTWALAKYLYSPSGPYFIIPMGIFIGMVPTLIQRAIAWQWPTLRLGPVHINDVILPIIWTVRCSPHPRALSVVNVYA